MLFRKKLDYIIESQSDDLLFPELLLIFAENKAQSVYVERVVGVAHQADYGVAHGHQLSNPLVPSGGLRVPNLMGNWVAVVVHESDAFEAGTKHHQNTNLTHCPGRVQLDCFESPSVPLAVVGFKQGRLHLVRELELEV